MSDGLDAGSRGRCRRRRNRRSGAMQTFLDRWGRTRRHTVRQIAAGGFVDVGADGEFESDVLIGLRVLVRNRAGSDHSYTQCSVLSCP